MRIVFAGTPAVAAPTLERLASEHDIVAVVTRVDAPVGRRRVLTPSPVADVAERLGLPVIKTNRLDEAVTDEVAALEPDLGVIVAYGGFVRERLLAVPRLGWINLHFSLLPRWRGAAPVQHALMAGDRTTGASVFQLVPAMDAGAVFATIETPVGAHQTAGNLLDALALEGASLTARVIDALQNGSAVSHDQVGDATLAPKLTIDDARLDFSRSSAEIYNRFRGVTPEPGAFTEIDDGQRFKIIDLEPARDAASLPSGQIDMIGGSVLVGTSDEPLRLVTVQPAGRKPMPATDWWRGRASTAQAIVIARASTPPPTLPATQDPTPKADR